MQTTAYELRISDWSSDVCSSVLLARVWSVRLRLADGDAAALISELGPVLAEGNPWRPLAIETEAALRLQTGEADKAVALYKSLADSPSKPSRLRARATAMVRAPGG